MAGFPAHTVFSGILVPAGTTELGAITHLHERIFYPLSNCAPSRTVLLKPTWTPSSIMHEYKKQLLSIVTLLPESLIVSTDVKWMWECFVGDELSAVQNTIFTNRGIWTDSDCVPQTFNLGSERDVCVWCSIDTSHHCRVWCEVSCWW